MTCSADDMKDFVVKLSIKGKGGHATGFFVAPGLVITCGHFIKNFEENSVIVSYKNYQYDAVLHGKSSDQRVDLATLRCLTTVPNHSCAHLDLSIEPDDRLRTYGCPQDYPEGCPETFTYDNRTGGIPPLLKFREGIVKSGLSGAPLWNERTGKICGVVKETRSENIDLGGGGVPSESIFSEWVHLVASSKLVDLILEMRAIEQVGLLEKTVASKVVTNIRDNLVRQEAVPTCALTVVEEWLEAVHPRFVYPDRDELAGVLNRMSRMNSGLSDAEIQILFGERESTKLEIMKGFIEQHYKNRNPSLKHCIPLFLLLCTNHEGFREWVSSYSSRVLDEFSDHTKGVLIRKLSNLYKRSS